MEVAPAEKSISNTHVNGKRKNSKLGNSLKIGYLSSLFSWFTLKIVVAIYKKCSRFVPIHLTGRIQFAHKKIRFSRNNLEEGNNFIPIGSCKYCPIRRSPSSQETIQRCNYLREQAGMDLRVVCNLASRRNTGHFRLYICRG